MATQAKGLEKWSKSKTQAKMVSTGRVPTRSSKKAEILRYIQY